MSRDEFEKANARAAARRASGPIAVDARYDRRLRRVIVRLSTGIDVAFALQDAQGLERATPADLARIEISPSGLGLHFPALDADLYVPALLEGILGSRSWMAARLGTRGRPRGADRRPRLSQPVRMNTDDVLLLCATRGTIPADPLVRRSPGG